MVSFSLWLSILFSFCLIWYFWHGIKYVGKIREWALHSKKVKRCFLRSEKKLFANSLKLARRLSGDIITVLSLLSNWSAVHIWWPIKRRNLEYEGSIRSSLILYITDSIILSLIKLVGDFCRAISCKLERNQKDWVNLLFFSGKWWKSWRGFSSHFRSCFRGYVFCRRYAHLDCFSLTWVLDLLRWFIEIILVKIAVKIMCSILRTLCLWFICVQRPSLCVESVCRVKDLARWAFWSITGTRLDRWARISHLSAVQV